MNVSYALIPLSYREYISRVEDRSDRLFKRRLVYFKNGWKLSVIIGMYTHGLYEVWATPPSGAQIPDLLQPIIESPLGYQTIEDVVNWAGLIIQAQGDSNAERAETQT